MTEGDGEQSIPQPPDVTRISARLTTPLHCAVGEERGNPRQALLVVTLGEPDGTTDVIALLPEDAPRLRRMIEEIEADAEAWRQDPKRTRNHFFRTTISRSERLVKFSGKIEYLEKLKLSNPGLAGYVEKQLTSFSRSIRRHVPSRRAARSLEGRMTTAILVAIDCARWTI